MRLVLWAREELEKEDIKAYDDHALDFEFE